MKQNPVTALSPLDGRYQASMEPLAELFSEYGLIRHRLLIEIRWLQALARESSIPEVSPLSSSANNWLNQLFDQFSVEDAEAVKTIEKTINHDVKAVEYHLKGLCQQMPELKAQSEFIHFGCTSEDINNLSYALMLKTARDEIILPALDQILEILRDRAHRYATFPQLSRTHGQPASPTTVGKTQADVLARLQKQRDRLAAIEIYGKFNGAVGNFNAHVVAYPEVDWQALSTKFIHDLGLHVQTYTTQIEPHDYIAELSHALMRINTILIDYSRDMWQYISLGYYQQIQVSHEVGSSTMPHKVNPIDFENAEGNLGLANALYEHFANKLPISRWQRDLSDSTVLRNLGMSLGYSLLAYQSLVKGLKKTEPNEQRLQDDLNQHWEILTEAIQTLMRRHGLPTPYEQLKALTRGEQLDAIGYRQLIDKLNLPPNLAEILHGLTPATYLGLAEKLAKNI